MEQTEQACSTAEYTRYGSSVEQRYVMLFLNIDLEVL
jgi:hypothetical protein